MPFKHLWVETIIPDLFQCSACGYWRYPLDKSVQMRATPVGITGVRFTRDKCDEEYWEEQKKTHSKNGLGYAYSNKRYVSISGGTLKGNWIINHLAGCTRTE